jgi:molybdopterin biosynthesis enzyme
MAQLCYDSEGCPCVLPYGNGSSANLVSLAQADGLIRLPVTQKGFLVGDELDFIPFDV